MLTDAQQRNAAKKFATEWEGCGAYYLFDYGDEWGHSISVKKVIPVKKKDCKFKLLQITGEIPEQYPDYDDDEEE
jgi:hypothetical protein